MGDIKEQGKQSETIETARAKLGHEQEQVEADLCYCEMMAEGGIFKNILPLEVENIGEQDTQHKETA